MVSNSFLGLTQDCIQSGSEGSASRGRAPFVVEPVRPQLRRVLMRGAGRAMGSMTIPGPVAGASKTW
ncbi:MAG: hypothetical protein DYG94_06975 [Leptolyngbya sp. PLA3]|nr:MAG: hypothetical protein EDM82_06320 [Cyanobacteria bacterium CYA]MCE7968471.1 hypothetical protein [Leptolyngbya sp. PL-A3]